MLSIFFTFVKVGLFSFGGGYAILAMIPQEVVSKHGWLSPGEFADVVAISQMTPGPIAINAATFIGFRQYGVLGSLLCTFGVILPSLVLMLILTLTYLKLRKRPWFQNIFKNLRLLSLGLIAAAMIMIGRGAFTDWFSVGIFGICFLIVWRWKINPVYVLVLAALLGMGLG